MEGFLLPVQGLGLPVVGFHGLLIRSILVYITIQQNLPVRRFSATIAGTDLRSLIADGAMTQDAPKAQRYTCRHYNPAPQGIFRQQHQHRNCRSQDQHRRDQPQQRLVFLQMPISGSIPVQALLSFHRGHPPEGCRNLRRGRHIRQTPGPQHSPPGLQILYLLQFCLGLFPAGLTGAPDFQFLKPPCCLIFVISGLNHMEGILPGLGIGQGHPVVFQFRHPLFQSGLLLPQALCLNVQAVQVPKLPLQVRRFRLCLGQQASAVVAAAVSQVPELFLQCLGSAAVIPSGHQGIQPVAQGLILGHRQVRQPDESGPGKDALFHPQQHGAAVGSGQLRHRQAGVGFKSLKISKNGAAFGLSLNGNVPALPAQVYGAGHGHTGPGGIVLLIRQSRSGGSGTGLQAIEHGNQEGTPGGFSPLIGGVDHIESRLQGQCLMLQLAEGGSHRIDLHGSTTSCPSRSFRDSLAASRICRAEVSSASSRASRRSRK